MLQSHQSSLRKFTVAARQTCLSLSGHTHKQHTHLHKLSGREPSRAFPSVPVVSVHACCVSETRWGSDPLSQHHANTSSPCASWQLLCVHSGLLEWLFSRTHTGPSVQRVIPTHDPVTLSALYLRTKHRH